LSSKRLADTTVRDALDSAVIALTAVGVDTPRLDAEVLLAAAMHVDRAVLIADPQRGLSPSEAGTFRDFARRRTQREPVAYILGRKGFRRLELEVDGRVLIPRPETEHVVEAALDLPAGARVVDVGTGSGAIALALKDERPDASVVGVDVSPAALELARENAGGLGLAVELRAGGAEVAAEGWDLVVSNPPYVRPDELERLEPEVREWEPREALVESGLHGRLARVAETRLLVLEVGDGQAGRVAAELAEAGYEGIRITADLSGTARVVEGRRA
jgi:release factor glutamine methyltransferase